METIFKGSPKRVSKGASSRGFALRSVLLRPGPTPAPRNLLSPFSVHVQVGKGRIWAIAVRRGSYKSLCLLNLEKQGNSVLNFGSRKTV